MIACTTGIISQAFDQGLRQFIAGSRKFGLEHMSRDDLAALNRQAAEIRGIRYLIDVDREEA